MMAREVQANHPPFGLPVHVEWLQMLTGGKTMHRMSHTLQAALISVKPPQTLSPSIAVT